MKKLYVKCSFGRYSHHPSDCNFAVQVALPKIVQPIGCVNIMSAVERNLLFFFLGERAVDVEWHGGFPNIHSEVRFDCFER